MLISARFDNDEVNAALVVLRENTKTNETRVDGLHKVFRTDEGLQIVTIMAESANALINGAIISHTMYPAAARRPKKNMYSTALLTFIVFICLIILGNTIKDQVYSWSNCYFRSSIICCEVRADASMR